MVRGRIGSASLERRTLRPPAAGSLLAQLDDWLRPDQDWSLSEEYPQVFGRRSMAFQHVLLDENKQLLAHAATLDLRYGDPRNDGLRCDSTGPCRNLTLRLIGAVVVSPDCRGQGHGSRLIQSLREDFSNEGPQALILWSDNLGFYERCGFQPLGSEQILRLRPTCLGPMLGTLRRAMVSDVPSLQALHAAKPQGTIRRQEDFETWLTIPHCETWVLIIEDEVVAYASLGKGLDFPDHIHECGGSDLDLASLLTTLLMEKGRDLGLLLPPYRKELRKLLLPSLVAETQTHLGLGISKHPLPRDFYLEGFDSI